MKASSFRYLINQGFKGIWKNRMMTFASFCILLVSLLMVGTSVLVSINLTRIIGGIEDQRAKSSLSLRTAQVRLICRPLKISSKRSEISIR